MKNLSKSYAIDANVIVRYLIQDDPRTTPKAVRIMEGIQDGEISATCDAVTIAEVVWVLGSVYGLAPTRIAEGLEPIVQCESLKISNKDRYLEALRLYGSAIPHFGDACLCAAALENCEGRVVSFDHGIKNIEGITRVDSV